MGAGTVSAETTTNYYDPAGNITGTSDGLGNLTKYEVDGMGRVTVTMTPLSTVGTVTTYSTVTTLFDGAGNVTEVIDADNNTTTFLYDALNRVTSQTQELGSGYSTTTFAYNSAGLLASQTNALGRSEDFLYDGLNRVTSEKWYLSGSTSPVQIFTSSYDAVGNLLTASNNAGTYTMQYDALNQVTAVAEPYGVALSFGYDSVGNRTSVQDFETLSGTLTAGFLIGSSYDSSNRLTSIVALQDGNALARVSLTYTADNNIATETRFEYPTPDYEQTQVGSTSILYDALDRVTGINYYYGSGSALGSIVYSYDSANNLTSETDNGGTPTSYTYNKSNELTEAGTTTYAYDAEGNRTQAGTFTYSTPNGGNELTNDGTWTYLYDAVGNITEKFNGTDTWTYSYDNDNHMLTAKEELTTNGATLVQATYTYDYFGNLLQEDYNLGSGAATVQYAYDGWNPADPTFEAWAILSNATTANSGLTTRFVRGDQVDQLFATLSSAGTPSWILQDRLGSTRYVANNDGTSVADTYNYDVYGNLTTTAPSVPMYLWTGQLYDPATGFYYERARYYDPQIGRWTTQDPLGPAGGDSNLTRYVLNAPTNYTDPTGKDAEDEESLDETAEQQAQPSPTVTPTPNYTKIANAFMQLQQQIAINNLVAMFGGPPAPPIETLPGYAAVVDAYNQLNQAALASLRFTVITDHWDLDIAAAIQDLYSNNYNIRERASAFLEEYVYYNPSLVVQALSTTDLEVQRRLGVVLYRSGLLEQAQRTQFLNVASQLPPGPLQQQFLFGNGSLFSMGSNLNLQRSPCIVSRNGTFNFVLPSSGGTD